MFIKITKSKGIKYLNIAEGYRENGKVKHRNIAGLGRLDTLVGSGSLETMALKLLTLAGNVASSNFLEETRPAMKCQYPQSKIF